jgi:uracil-DNA glycosylase
LIILLGRTAVKGLLPEQAKAPLDALRKASKAGAYSYGDVILVSYHPSALLRDPSRRIGAAEDFRFIEEWKLIS